MTHDAVVVGAGLAGLCAALRLAEAGRRVLVVARGVGGLPLSAGTIDVLGYAPDRVDSPAEALPGFVAAHPEHPYARVSGALTPALEWFRERVAGLGYGGGMTRNLLLPTALGVARPTALAPRSMMAGALPGGGRFVIAGLRALKDLHPALLADNLVRAELPGAPPLATRALSLSASPRPGEAEVAGQVFARALDTPEFRRSLAGELRPQLEPGEAVGLPAVLGLERGDEGWAALQEALGAPVFEIPTPPPSVPGMRLYRALTGALRRAGGRLVVGPEAVGGEGDGGRLAGVVVHESGRTRTHTAPAVVLASGGLASGGVVLDSHGVLREAVFGLPVSGPSPETWRGLSPRYLDPQPLLAAGVVVDDALRPLDAEGRPVYENLHAAGDVLAGALPWREKSGEGLAIAGGYAAATAILGGS